jgi:two-component system response regulator NreC
VPVYRYDEGKTTVHPQTENYPQERIAGNKVRCVLAHDYRLLRQGIRYLLADEADIEIVAESVNAAEALRQVFEHRPDVVIARTDLFDGTASDALRMIRQESPASTVLFLNASVEDGATAGAPRDGAAFVTPDTSAEEFVGMIRGAHPEHEPTVREMPLKVVSEWQAVEGGRARKRVLTAREREVLKLLAEGQTVRSAAAFLGLSIKTVDAHKFNLMRKLGIHNKAELVMWAIQKRVVKLPANF